MKKVKIYLSGAMENCTEQEMKEWRDKFQDDFHDPVLSGKYQFVDPTRTIHKKMSFKEIVMMNKYDIDNCDILFVNWIKLDDVRAGTSMEILYAWEKGKYVLVVDPHKNAIINPFVEYHSHTIFETMNEAKFHLRTLILEAQ